MSFSRNFLGGDKGGGKGGGKGYDDDDGSIADARVTIHDAIGAGWSGEATRAVSAFAPSGDLRYLTQDRRLDSLLGAATSGFSVRPEGGRARAAVSRWAQATSAR